MIPKGWEQLKAREVFDSVSKKNHPDEELLSATQDMGVIPRSMLSARVTMPTKNIETFKLVDEGDFVISLRSFQGGIEYSQYRGIVSPAYTILKNKVEICSEFFKYYFKTSKFINDLDSSVVGIRDGKQISYKDFAEIYLPCPPLPEQKKIAAILKSVDDTIQTTQAVIDQTQRIKQGLMQQLLTRGIGHTRFKQTGIGEIPEEWTVIKIKDACYVNKENIKPSTDEDYEINYIDITSIEYTGCVPDRKKLLFRDAPSRARRVVKNSNILVSTVRPNLRGFTFIENAEENLVCSTGFAVLECKNEFSPRYVYQFILSDLFLRQVSKKLVGSNYPAINNDDLENVKIAVPDTIEEQIKIAEVLLEIDTQIECNNNYLSKIQEIKRGLMQDLLIGRVRVKLNEVTTK